MRSKKGSIVKESKTGEVQKLKNRIKRLERDKKILVSKLNSAEAALGCNVKFLKGSTEDLSVEELIEAAKDNKSLKNIRDDKTCPNCGKDDLKVMKTLFGILETCKCGYRNKRIDNED